MQAVPMSQVAKEAGVSVMTVSRALRSSPLVARDTKERVLATAKRLGYRPNPFVNALMEQVRRRRSFGARAETMAFLLPQPPAVAAQMSYKRPLLDGLAARASQHGYGVDHFQYTLDPSGARRLAGILLARGIRGVVIDYTECPPLECLQLPLAEIAVVALLAATRDLRLHCVLLDNYGIMIEALQVARARGYRRPALAIDAFNNDLVERRWTACYTEFTARLGLQAVPALESKFEPDRPAPFQQWLRRTKPDLVLSDSLLVADWIPAGAADYCCLDLPTEATPLAGFRQHYREAAETAVDVLETQLRLNELGPPTEPRCTKLGATLHEGTRRWRRPPAT